MRETLRRRGRLTFATCLTLAVAMATLGITAVSSGASKALKKPPKIVIGFAAITEAAPVVTQSIASFGSQTR